jgi:cell division protein FtsB
VRAQNAELLMRMRRLTPVLVSLARELAIARREGAALQRENRRLRSQVASLEERGAGGHGQPAATPGKPRQRASERIPG